LFSFFRRSKSDTGSVPTETRDTSVVSSPADWLLNLFGGTQTLSEIDINPQSALGVPAVRAAVELIAGVMGTLPVDIYRPSADGGSEIATDHPAQRLLRRSANPWTAGAALRRQVTVDALLHSDGFAFVNRAGNQPRELIRLQPGSIATEVDKNTLEPRYRTTGTNPRTFGFGDMIHLRSIISLDGYTGQSPIKTAREAIALCLAFERYAARLMAAGGRPSGILTFPNTLGDKSAAKMAASWKAATAGAAGGGTAVLEEGGAFTPLAFNSVDAQFMEMRAFGITEVARAFAVPPPFLHDLSRATWSNFTQAATQLVQFCLLPWARAWEETYDLALLTQEERDAGYGASFDFDSLLDGDLLARAQAYSSLISSRVLNPNEAREREGLPAYAEGNVFANPNTTIGGRPSGSNANG